jgi:CRP-like cAMP-binding protein
LYNRLSMYMYNTDILLQTLRSKVEVPDNEYAEYIALTELRIFKKGEIIVHEGSIQRFNIFIIKGCIRTFNIAADGTEKTIYFAEEGYWTGDLESMRNQTPANHNFQALEETHVLTLSRDDWEQTYKKYKWKADIHALGMQRRMIKLSEHIGRILSDPPEVNYLRLLKERPKLVQRVPLYHIASYLGISAETLSRIRKKIVSESIS